MSAAIRAFDGGFWGPFVAGATSVSLLWLGLSFVSSLSSSPAVNDDDGDLRQRGPDELQFLDDSNHPWWMNRIGELPLKTTLKRIPWPWKRMRSNKSNRGFKNGFRTLSQEDETDDDDDDEEFLKSGLCIGDIFGLDVGGTLAKLIYFEKIDSPLVRTHIQSERFNGQSDHSHAVHLSPLWRVEGTAEEDSNIPSNSIPPIPRSAPMEQTQSESTYLEVKNSLVCDSLLTPNLNEESKSTDSSNQHFLKNREDRPARHIASPKDHAEALENFYRFVRSLDHIGGRTGGIAKDKHLSFYSRELGGNIHFIQFETREMAGAMDLIKAHNLHLNIVEMGATGGGAHKFADKWKQLLGIEMKKQDELDSLVAGMQFVLADVLGESFTYMPQRSVETNDSSSDEEGQPSSTSSDSEREYEEEGAKGLDKNVGVDDWWWSRKVRRDGFTNSASYPYLLVTLGTGVSILRVDGLRKHERISGSTIGGGTYLGLCRLLTDCESFDDILNLAMRGDPSKVDMMVGDIYGRNTDALEKLGLPSNVVASSFGKLVAKADPAAGLTQEDLARALLLMVTNNIGQVAYLNAQLHNTSQIYFVGNFLRQNKISRRRLAYAINYWSKGKMEALFLEHEGYFGALGAFLLSQAAEGRTARNLFHKAKSMPLKQHQRKFSLG